MVFVDLPRRRRRRASAAAATAGLSVRVLGIEVTQAIQNMAHEVRLIGGKSAVVRVYLATSGVSSNLRVRGEIVVSAAPDAPGSYIASANEVVLRSTGHPALTAQRRDAALSLNFLLPDPPAGPMTVRLKRISRAAGDEVPVALGDNERQVDFGSAPVLRIRTLGLRYVDPRQNPAPRFAPDPTHFAHLRSYLTRAYPVSRVEWSQAVIDAPANFVPPFSGPTLPGGFDPLWWTLLGILHQHMLTIRQSDMDAGWDPRTHYYGLVCDQSDFFRGAANAVPPAPAPNTIAVGPCGKPKTGSWDSDGSYGDWYGAHELAHTFGRNHPGFCQNQGRVDAQFPHSNGHISDAGQDCVGFDVGDSALNLPMRAYPREDWSDFMTYCERQWVSKYTYDGIYDRLVAEEAQFAPPVV
jgi:hypothetical protein